MFKFLVNKLKSRKSHIDTHDFQKIIPEWFVKGTTLEFMYWAIHPDTIIQRYQQSNALSIRHKIDKENFMFLIDPPEGDENIKVYKHERFELPDNIQKSIHNDPQKITDKLGGLYLKEISKINEE